MIISQIKYGFGNQLSQYAFGKRMSIEKNEPHVIDISWYNGFGKKDSETNRNFSLDQLKIDVNLADKSTLIKYRPSKLKYYFLAMLKIYFFNIYLKFGYIEEWTFSKKSFDPILVGKQLNCDLYLKGIWMNHKYFSPIKDILQIEFNLKSEPNFYIKSLLDEIRNTNSVFIHIRQDDYLQKRTHDLGGAFNFEYYESAIDYVRANTINPRFYIFSDEIDKIRDKFKNEKKVVFIDKSPSDLDDFRLMKSCKHGIICNSTFSWWPAFLIENKNKIIVCPKKWSKQDTTTSISKIAPGWVSF